MANPAQVVHGFKEAIGKGDLAAARKYLRDDLSFKGPFDTFSQPEPYLEALKKLAGVVKGVEMKKMFVDGNDVCLLYDMVTNTPVGTSFICEWLQVKGDQIAAIRVVFDARPWAPLFGK
ncbi:MAG TPA: nuclear transport factor 2 family protein [Polyangia bacterium]|nr:nuclear transport factor 2 family protein [Polyangia bacterium]